MALNYLLQNVIPSMAVQTTTAAPFERIFQMLADFGLFRVVLPMLLIFVIFYAIIVKTGILGKPEDAWVKPAAAVIGLVSGFFVVAYTPVISALYNLIPQAGFLLVVLVLMLMVLGMLGIPVTEKFSEKFTALGVIIAIVVVLLFVAMAGFAVGPNVPILYGFSQLMMGAIALPELTADMAAMIAAVIVLLVIIGGVLYFVTKR